MLKIDLVIGGVIGAAVLFSILGVATYERAAGPTLYDVTWNSAEVRLAQKQESQMGNTGASGRTIEYPVNVQNLTEVALTVRVQGGSTARPSAVNVDIKVTPVNGTEETKRVTLAAPNGGAQEASFTIRIQNAPNATEESGASQNETLAKLNETNSNSRGAGVWRITVTITGATQGPVGGIGAETFQITINGEAERFFASVQPKTPDISR